MAAPKEAGDGVVEFVSHVVPHINYDPAEFVFNLESSDVCLSTSIEYYVRKNAVALDPFDASGVAMPPSHQHSCVSGGSSYGASSEGTDSYFNFDDCRSNSSSASSQQTAHVSSRNRILGRNAVAVRGVSSIVFVCFAAAGTGCSTRQQIGLFSIVPVRQSYVFKPIFGGPEDRFEYRLE